MSMPRYIYLVQVKCGSHILNECVCKSRRAAENYGISKVEELYKNNPYMLNEERVSYVYFVRAITYLDN